MQGTPERPRLAVFKSLKYTYAQLINDLEGRTVAQASSPKKDIRAAAKDGKRLDAARLVGEAIAESEPRRSVSSRWSSIGAAIFIMDACGKLQRVRARRDCSSERFGCSRRPAWLEISKETASFLNR